MMEVGVGVGGGGDTWSSSSCDSDGDEVCVWVGGKKLYVSGVRATTTCGEVVRALLPHNTSSGGHSSRWAITERWRSMEQPLDDHLTILDIWNAWGDAQDEIRLNLRCVDSSGDSGRGSPPSPRPHRKRRPYSLHHPKSLPTLLKAQGHTLRKQATKLKEQDQQISQLEEKTHRTRMAKHGPNYVLESYLRDIAKNSEARKENKESDEDDMGEYESRVTACKSAPSTSSDIKNNETQDNNGRSSEATDSPAANSDSGVGVGGSPPRPTKKRSRGKQLLREHYLTKELTDICQINASKIFNTKTDDNSENSADEFSKIQQQIKILEKLSIINKRLQKEEELIVRLGSKLRRYLSEDHISYIENEEEIVTMLSQIRKQMDNSSKEIESTAIEMERASDQIEKRKQMFENLCKELEAADEESKILENEMHKMSIYDNPAQLVNPYIANESYYNLSNTSQYSVPMNVDMSMNVSNYSFNNNINYPLDTLV